VEMGTGGDPRTWRFGGAPPGGGGPPGRFPRLRRSWWTRRRFRPQAGRDIPFLRGPGGGSSVSAIRRAGSRNQLHSSLSATLSNSRAQCPAALADGQTVGQAVLREHAEPASFSGPLNIPHLVHYERSFSFVNYSAARAKRLHRTGNVPTALDAAETFRNRSRKVRSAFRSFDARALPG